MGCTVCDLKERPRDVAYSNFGWNVVLFFVAYSDDLVVFLGTVTYAGRDCPVVFGILWGFFGTTSMVLGDW